jgi:hypothetical protein
MPGHLQNEAAVAAFVEELVARRAAHGEAAQDERAGGVGQSLVAAFPALPDQGDSLGLAQFLFGDEQVAVGPGEQFADGLHHENRPLQSR